MTDRGQQTSRHGHDVSCLVRRLASGRVRVASGEARRREDHLPRSAPRYAEAVHGDDVRTGVPDHGRDDGRRSLRDRREQALSRTRQERAGTTSNSSLRRSSTTRSTPCSAASKEVCRRSPPCTPESLVGRQSNRPAVDADLSLTSLQAAVEAFHGWTDEAGMQAVFTPKLLVVGVSNLWTATVLLSSEQVPGNNFNDPNRSGEDGHSALHLPLSHGP